MQITDDVLSVFTTTTNRLKVTRKSIDELTEIPTYTLWQILARYDEACGGKTEGKEWRYKIMDWLFPGKWQPHEQPSGNDLDEAEIHLMARWSDPARKDEFEYEIAVVRAMLGHHQDFPLATEITSPVTDHKLIKSGISDDEQKAIFREHLGVRKYKMLCGHLNDDYTVLGHPMCSVCLNKSRESNDQALWEKAMRISVEMDW